jgi:hypothetical protein
MADVYRARDEHLQRDVAVKLFRMDAPEGDDRRRVQAEIDALSRLVHPGIVRVLDAHTADETPDDAPDVESPFVVMELITGGTLAQRLAHGQMTEHEAAAMGCELASTLAYVHALGVVHRDVKPANVLLDEPVDGECRARLADFGVARLLDSTRMTLTGTTVGTANYLSPEQALGADVGPAADVYSLGLVLLECLTGRLVYPGTGVEAALARLHQQPVVPVGLGPRWSRLLCAMTARHAADRITAAEAAQELAELAHDFSSGRVLDLPTRPAQAVAAVDAETGPLAVGPFAVGSPGAAAVARPWWRRGGRRRAAWCGGGVGVAGTAVVLALTAFSTDAPAVPTPTTSRPAATASAAPVPTATATATATVVRVVTAPATPASTASAAAVTVHHARAAAHKPAPHKAPPKPAHHKPHGHPGHKPPHHH